MKASFSASVSALVRLAWIKHAGLLNMLAPFFFPTTGGLNNIPANTIPVPKTILVGS